MDKSIKQGVVLAASAYTMWGIAPAYFKLIDAVPSTEILIHRIVWSTLLLMIIVAMRSHIGKVLQIIKQPKTMAILFVSAAILAFNWWLFIWSVNNNHILDASLGYYINPLLNVALGMVFLGERLSRLQLVAVALALIGVLIQVITFGSFPVIAFSLAASFATYGLIRKTLTVDSMTGLLIESAILLLPACGYWWFFADSPAADMTANGMGLNLLLMAAGIVTTAPLLCFVAAARRLNYSTMGFFQYIGPSLMFIFGVFVYHEQFGQDRWITFGFIWLALLIYVIASIRKYRKA